MFSTITIVHFTLVERILGFFQKVLHQIYSIVEIVVIHVAAENVDLAFQLGTERFPVSLQDVSKVVVLPPIVRNLPEDGWTIRMSADLLISKPIQNAVARIRYWLVPHDEI